MLKETEWMSIENDRIPVNIVEMVERMVVEEFNGKPSSCKSVWERKKELFAQAGYVWFAPSEISPCHIFD